MTISINTFTQTLELSTSSATHKRWSVCSQVASTCIYLVAGRAARLQSLGVVTAAVDLPVLVEVDEVHLELLARAAHEAGGVPTHTVAGSRCEHGDVAAVYLASTLQKRKYIYIVETLFHQVKPQITTISILGPS